MGKHARLAPSSMSRRIACPGSLALEELQPKQTSVYAEEGTAAHEVLEAAFDGVDLSTLVGTSAENGIEITTEMVTHAKDIKERVHLDIEAHFQAGAVSVRKYIERRVDFSEVIEVPDSFGQADIILLVEYPNQVVLSVQDFKYGMGVSVFAERNAQLMTYALGAYDMFSYIEDIEYIELVVHQPRISHHDVWQCTAEELVKFGEQLKEVAENALLGAEYLHTGKWEARDLELNPGDDQCRFCRAKSTCPALKNRVFETVGLDITDAFDDLDETEILDIPSDLEELNELMKLTDLVEGWCRSVRKRVEDELLAGNTLPDWKLVEGRRGHRRWVDETQVEKLMRGMRIKVKDMYVQKLISPTQAESVLPPKRWKQLQSKIVQSEGKPSVAHRDSKRPALVIDPAAGFEDLDAA